MKYIKLNLKKKNQFPVNTLYNKFYFRYRFSKEFNKLNFI